MPAEVPPAAYRIGRFVLDLRRGALLLDGVERPLRPKSYALLRYLVEHSQRLVGRDEIMQAVWPDTFVTEDSITQCVREIRRVLDDEAQTLLRTLIRRGYLLASAVERLEEPGRKAAPADTLPQVLAQPPTGRPMVVVLPFENIGGDPDQGYFADGLTADLVTDLTRFQDLHVVNPPRSTEGLPAAANYSFVGSVRRAGGRLRITVQLKDARSGVALWADRFDRPLEDLFDVQEDLTNRIAAAVDLQIGREGLRQARRRPPANLGAYDLYLQGRELHGKVTEADTILARALLDRAITADPSHAPAYAWQAYLVQRGFTFGWGEPRGRAALDAALTVARKGVALEPDSSLCLIREALVLALLGRGDEAVEMGGRAVQANPSDAACRASYGESLSMAGDHARSVEELRLAIALNPYHPPFWRGTLGRSLLLAGQPEAALVELRRCTAQAPDYRSAHSSTVVACVELGRLAEARVAMAEVLRLRPGWVIKDYDGVFGFQRQVDVDRFLAAFRAAGMPESQEAVAGLRVEHES